MNISTRELEEDEARIDNLLNKVMHSVNLIETLNEQLKDACNSGPLDKGHILDVASKIGMLAKTVSNLVGLADNIDVNDESITKKLEGELKLKLAEAIGRIKDANSFLEQTTSG